jgi:hypothetical protein
MYQIFHLFRWLHMTRFQLWYTAVHVHALWESEIAIEVDACIPPNRVHSVWNVMCSLLRQTLCESSCQSLQTEEMFCVKICEQGSIQPRAFNKTLLRGRYVKILTRISSGRSWRWRSVLGASSGSTSRSLETAAGWWTFSVTNFFFFASSKCIALFWSEEESIKQ